MWECLFLLLTVSRTVGTCLNPREDRFYSMHVLKAISNLEELWFWNISVGNCRTFRNNEVVEYLNSLARSGECVYQGSRQTCRRVNFYLLLFKCIWFRDTEQSYILLFKATKLLFSKLSKLLGHFQQRRKSTVCNTSCTFVFSRYIRELNI